MCRCAAIRLSSCSARAFSSAAARVARAGGLGTAACACERVVGAASVPSNAGCSVPRTHREKIAGDVRRTGGNEKEARRAPVSRQQCAGAGEERQQASHLCAPRPGRAPAAEAQSGDDEYCPTGERRRGAPEALGLDEPEYDRKRALPHPLPFRSRELSTRGNKNLF